ncbi:MAG: aminodeoxychorismate/anthranilate synthase component II [Lachnospiraceae bacterium]|nr:aminodeoxychorismate/anthranilate synthase component II [Lachnospiraceae bacterium]
MILLVDNYDSFSYNLYQLIGSFDEDIKVIRNDELTVDEVLDLRPNVIVISPGPGKPEDAGICVELVKAAAGKIPVLGVCLGHQAITVAFGGVVSYADQIMHGKQSETKIDKTCAIFKGCDDIMKVARYHSLASMRESLPECLKITCETEDGVIMGVAHKNYDVYGLQFHPESILTPDGGKIIKNFLDLAKAN